MHAEKKGSTSGELLDHHRGRVETVHYPGCAGVSLGSKTSQRTGIWKWGGLDDLTGIAASVILSVESNVRTKVAGVDYFFGVLRDPEADMVE